MDYTTLGIIALTIAGTLAAIFALRNVKAPAAVIAVEKKVEDYTHAETVKLVGSLLDHLGDTSPAQAKIASGQAEIAAQAQLLAAIKARVAAAGLSAAS